MFTAFSTALSALNAHSTAVDVVGNNLANLNTPGYKTSVVSFRDLVTQSVGAGMGETQVGFGTGRPLTMRQFTQGAIESSTGLLDVAIQGDGFFIVRDARDAAFFTRAGNFQVDDQGHLMTPTGEWVQGWPQLADGTVDPNAAISNLVVPVGTLKPPAATTKFSVDLNLNAAAQHEQPEGTWSTPMPVIDSVGQKHILKITFTKTANPNEWDYSITIPGAEVGDTDPEHEVTNGTIRFDASGKMIEPDTDPGTVAMTIDNLANDANKLDLEWELYTPAQIPRLTQYSQPSAPSANSQNGSAAASIIRVGLADGGRVLAQYSDGQQVIVGQLALASIRNPESLIAGGNNNFYASARTALPAVGLPETGGRGKIVGGSLEYSTVDIAREFTNLIIYQRGYQANSRVITAVDELSQETINLKR